MNKELLKQLKDSGFERTLAAVMMSDSNEPGLSELIEACKNDLAYMAPVAIKTGENEISDGWEVCQKTDKGETARLIQEFSLEEALSKLWLVVNEKK